MTLQMGKIDNPHQPAPQPPAERGWPRAHAGGASLFVSHNVACRRTRRVPAPVSARSSMVITVYSFGGRSNPLRDDVLTKFRKFTTQLANGVSCHFKNGLQDVRGQAALIACLQARGDDADKGTRRGVLARWQQQGHWPARWPRDVPGDHQSAEPAASSGCVAARC